MTKNISTVKLAALLSVSVHLALSGWLLRSERAELPVAKPLGAPERRLSLQLLTQPVNKGLAPSQSTATETLQAAVRSAKRTGALTSPELTAEPQAPVQHGLTEVQTPSSAATTPALPALNLDLSRAVKSTELQRRKSPLAGAIDAQQSENSRTPEQRAFAKLAPRGSSIVSETLMADGTRLIKFSAGGCMRLVNPSSRHFDDMRRPGVETC